MAGYRGGAEGPYVHLTGGSAWLRTEQASGTAARPVPYLYEANARLADWSAAADGTRVDFRLQGHAPLAFSLANARGCQVRADRRAIAPERQAPATAGTDVLAYRLPHAAAQIQLQCPAR